MKKVLTWTEVIFTLLSLVFYTGGPIYLLLSQGYSEGDSTGLAQTPVFDFSLARDLFLLNYVCTAGLLALRWKQALHVLCKERVLVGLVLFAGLSVLWSIDPATTQARGIALVGTTLFGFYLASRYSLRQQCYLLASAFGLVIASSLLFVVALPQYGIMGGTAHAGAWRGIYAHKNQLGKMMTLAVALFVLLLRDARSRWVKGMMLCGIGSGVLLLLMSRSTTALIIGLLILPLIPAWQLLRLRTRALVPTLMLGTCLLASGAMIFVWNVDSVLAWFQKDLTLSGRTQLWSALWDAIARRPWLGYGFNGFWDSGWGSPVGEVWRAVRWRPPSAHNSWFDVWIEIGAVGLALMALSLLLLFVKATRWARASRSFSGLWPLTFLCCLFFNSLTETSLLTENDVLWVLYSALAFTLSAQTIRVPRPQLLSPVGRSHPDLLPVGAMAGVGASPRLFGNNPFTLASFELNSEAATSGRDTEREGAASTAPIESPGIVSKDGLRTRAAQFAIDRLTAQYDLDAEAAVQENATQEHGIGEAQEHPRQEPWIHSRSADHVAELADASPSNTSSSENSLARSGTLLQSETGIQRATRDDNTIAGHFTRLGLVGSRLWERLIRLNLWRSAMVELFARILRVAIQAAYFILLTRILTVQEYGIFTSISATVGLVVPFATVGAEHLIIRDLSRDQKKFPTFFGNALMVSGAASTLLTILVVFAAHLFFAETVSFTFILLIALSDLFCLKLIEIGQNVFLTLNLPVKAAFLNILMSLKNLLAILVFAGAFATQTLEGWALCYCISTVIGAIVAFFVCTLTLGFPRFSAQRPWGDLKEGLYFSVGIAAHNINSNIDKTMLLKWSTAGEAGIYAAAYRIITIALTPMFSLMAISYSKFFASGESGLKGSLNFASKIFPVAAGYGLISTLLLAMGAPLIVLLFGSDYANCVEAVRWLSPLLMIHSVKFLMEDSLAGAGLQRTRSFLQIGAACFNILLNLWLLPLYSWRGAAWSSLASELFLIITLLYCVRRYYRLEQSAGISP